MLRQDSPFWFEVLSSAAGPSEGHLRSLFSSLPRSAPILRCPGGRWAGRAGLVSAVFKGLQVLSVMT